MKKLFLLGLLGIISSTSCATIMHGNSQEVSINSEPEGATVYIDGQERGKTPLSLLLSRKRERYIVTIKKDCYLPKTVEINRAISGSVAGNIIAGGIIGGVIDVASGGAYKLVPDKINVILQPDPKCQQKEH